jgi:hypothetical protein
MRNHNRMVAAAAIALAGVVLLGEAAQPASALQDSHTSGTGPSGIDASAPNGTGPSGIDTTGGPRGIAVGTNVGTDPARNVNPNARSGNTQTPPPVRDDPNSLGGGTGMGANALRTTAAGPQDAPARAGSTPTAAGAPSVTGTGTSAAGTAGAGGTRSFGRTSSGSGTTGSPGGASARGPSGGGNGSGAGGSRSSSSGGGAGGR